MCLKACLENGSDKCKDVEYHPAKENCVAHSGTCDYKESWEPEWSFSKIYTQSKTDGKDSSLQGNRDNVFDAVSNIY